MNPVPSFNSGVVEHDCGSVGPNRRNAQWDGLGHARALDKPASNNYPAHTSQFYLNIVNKPIRPTVHREFRADIQALRGLAVLLVVIYHSNLGFLTAGYLGVDIFFVISGFLITDLIKTQLEQNRFSFWQFYYRRAKRLLPAAYVVIALTTILSPLFLSDLGLQELKYQVLGALTFTGNIALWLQSDYFAEAAETKPLLHVWSLAIEEQYYLLLPAFLALAPRKLWLMGLGGLLVASLALCFYLAPRDPSAAFYLLPTRFWEMAIGSVGALLPAHHVLASRLSLLRLPALTVLLVIPLFPIGSPHPGLDAALVCAATLAVLLTHTKENIVIRSVAKIGDISYSLYLIHWPVLVYVRAAWLTEVPELAIYGALAFSFVASWGLHRFVEEPFRRNFFNAPVRLASGLAGTSLVLGLVPSIVIAATASDVDFRKIRRNNLGLGSACVFKPGSPPTSIPAECQTTNAPELLVWGDSFAMHLVPGLAEAIGQKGLAQLTMSACGPAVGAAPFWAGSSRYPRAFAEDCIRFNDHVVAILKSRPEIRIVAISSPFRAPIDPSSTTLVRRGRTFEEYATTTTLAVAGIRSLVEEVRAMGKRVVVIAPPPSSGINIGDCLERRARGRIVLGQYRDCDIPVFERLAYQGRTLKMLEQLSSEAGVKVVSLDSFLCDERVCKTEINGKFIYRDYAHLSYEGSSIVFRQSGVTERLISASH